MCLSAFCGAYAARIIMFFALRILGYTPHGIKRGSMASMIMKLEAYLSGGEICTNGISATLQGLVDHGPRGTFKWNVMAYGAICGVGFALRAW